MAVAPLFTTTIDASAADNDTILVSAGKIGYQVELSLAELNKAIPCQVAELV